MSVKAIKAKAEELLSFGIPKQQAFDNLMLQFPEAKPKKKPAAKKSGKKKT